MKGVIYTSNALVVYWQKWKIASSERNQDMITKLTKTNMYVSKSCFSVSFKILKSKVPIFQRETKSTKSEWDDYEEWE